MSKRILKTINIKKSINLDENTLKAIENYRIEEYRRKQEKISSLTEAMLDLIHKGLEEKKEIIKEDNTIIPKEAIKLEDLTLRIRAPSKERGGSSIINLPYKTVLDHGLKNLDKIDAWISRKALG